MSTALLTGLPPLIDDRARILILGSFPGAESLAVGQYYANPRNAFWPLVGEIFGFDCTATYPDRLAALQAHGVALWDVLHACRRVGSLDSAIDPKSLQVNNFDLLLAEYPGVERVYFNGAKAAEVYRRHVRVGATLRYQRLPSSSPAHATKPGVKLAAWRALESS